MSRHTNAMYERKTTGFRREPGGLERAVLYLLIDGYATAFDIASILETSSQNVYGALCRLKYSGLALQDVGRIPHRWESSERGSKLVQLGELWT